jgi:hypothetical protein
MKKLVIFASHIPSDREIHIGEDILKKIKTYLGEDVDIFAGVNPSPSLDKWLTVLKKYTDNIEVTPSELVINSDASAYQSALRLYNNNINDYDLVWFLHTQGTQSKNDKARERHLDTLLYNQSDVINIFNDNTIGVYGHSLVPLPNYNTPHEWDFMLDRFGVKRKNRPIRCFFSGTMYVMRGHILNDFLGKCNDDFLNSLLYNSFGGSDIGDKWFFERDFIHIVDSYHDYTLKPRHITDWHNSPPMDDNEYLRLINTWKKQL